MNFCGAPARKSFPTKGRRQGEQASPRCRRSLRWRLVDGIWKRVGEAEAAGGTSAVVAESAGGPWAPVPAMAVRKVKREVAERP